MKIAIRHAIGFVVLLLAAAPPATAPAAAPESERIDLFEADKGGYVMYRIPGVVVTTEGTVLAYCEARKAANDWATIDVLLRRSTDGGRTWDGPRQVAHLGPRVPRSQVAIDRKQGKPDDQTVNNPVAIVDRKTGAVHFLYCVEYARCFYMRSDDDGVTFSKPVDVTPAFDAFRPEYDWKVLATGPAHGIQLRTGRLVVPVWLSTGAKGHRPSVTATVYSDDAGQTWHRGDVAVPNTAEWVNPNETVVVELADGRVMLNVRSESKASRRLVTISPDGATKWTKPRFDDALLEPICMASIARLTAKADGADRDRIVFANPHNLGRGPDGSNIAGKSADRKNLSLKLSYDEGETWPVNKPLEPGPSAYSDLAALPDGTILCLYERAAPGGKTPYGLLTLARIDVSWLTDGKDHIAPTAKASRDSTGTDRATPLLAAAGTAARGAAPARPPVTTDVCVYGATSGGVAAAVQSARMGKRTVLLDPGRHLGGMTAGGLSAVDIGDPRSVGGIAREYFTRLAGQYGKTLAWDRPFASAGSGPATGGAYAVEPHVAEKVFDDMARAAGVTVQFNWRLATARKDAARITELVAEDGATVRAKVFIDATYEGDLMAKTGVSYTLMREGNAKYGEQYNGIHYAAIYKPRLKHDAPRANGRTPSGQGVWDRDWPLDPYVVPGDPTSGLLPLVQPGDPGTPGDPAPGVQAYCYRLCLTTAADRLPIAPPADYDPKRYELVARFAAACVAAGDDVDLRWFAKRDPLPHDKWDFNTATFGGNLPGASWAWPEADYDRRAAIAKEHEDYHRGLLHFLVTDPRIPAKVRDELKRFGLPRDEFTDNGGWPHQLYAREGRRMVSDLVMTEHHTFGRQTAPQSIGLGSYGTDTHEIRRIVKDGVVTREGKTAGGRGGAPPYPIGYGAIVPRLAECENLLVSFALSASHTAFSSIRMEPVFMVTSQSAAAAACLAIDAGVPVQRIDYERLRERLLVDGQVIQWPPAGTGGARVGGARD